MNNEAIVLNDDGLDGLNKVAKCADAITPEQRKTIRSLGVELDMTLRSLTSFYKNDFERCLNLGLRVFEKQRVLPGKYLSILAYSSTKCDRTGDLAMPIYYYSENCIKMGDYQQAMYGFRQLFTFPAPSTSIPLTENIEITFKVSDFHTVIANSLRPPVKRDRSPLNGRPLNLALVSVFCAGTYTAFSKTALQFADYVPQDRYNTFLYYTDSCTTARPQHFPIPYNQLTSEEASADLLNEMRSKGVGISCIPSDLSFPQAAEWLSQKMEDDAIDAVIFQGGIGHAIMWAASAISHVPSKSTLCCGTTMLQPGHSATIYMNETNMVKESKFWKKEWGDQIFIGGGADIRDAQNTPTPDKDKLDIPKNSIVFGVLGNYLKDRLTMVYLDCVTDILKECPNAYFLAMGSGSPDFAKAHLERHGVADRCRWLGPQSNAFSALKYLDFYYNEIPVGSSQSIRECIACGVPALAMHCSDKHAESVGANIVGSPHAVMEYSPDEYVRRAISWIKNPGELKAAGEAALKRAQEHYSAQTFIEQLCDCMASYCKEPDIPHVLPV